MSSLSRILYPISASDGHPSGVTIIHQYLITGSESLYVDRYPITSLSFSHSVNSGVYSARRSISATNPSLPAMMPDTKTYQLPPTGEIDIVLIPNSPRFLIHYRKLITSEQDLSPVALHDRFASNGWSSQWIWRYGKDQRSVRKHQAMHDILRRTLTVDQYVSTSPSQYRWRFR
jgi:hypothetical protein